MWIYIETHTMDGAGRVDGVEYTVGHYNPEGRFVPEWTGTRSQCVYRCHYLNGGEVVGYEPS